MPQLWAWLTDWRLEQSADRVRRLYRPARSRSEHAAAKAEVLFATCVSVILPLNRTSYYSGVQRRGQLPPRQCWQVRAVYPCIRSRRNISYCKVMGLAVAGSWASPSTIEETGGAARARSATGRRTRGATSAERRRHQSPTRVDRVLDRCEIAGDGPATSASANGASWPRWTAGPWPRPSPPRPPKGDSRCKTDFSTRHFHASNKNA
jgi:hypothetical protein